MKKALAVFLAVLFVATLFSLSIQAELQEVYRNEMNTNTDFTIQKEGKFTSTSIYSEWGAVLPYIDGTGYRCYENHQLQTHRQTISKYFSDSFEFDTIEVVFLIDNYGFPDYNLDGFNTFRFVDDDNLGDWKLIRIEANHTVDGVGNYNLDVRVGESVDGWPNYNDYENLLLPETWYSIRYTEYESGSIIQIMNIKTQTLVRTFQFGNALTNGIGLFQALTQDDGLFIDYISCEAESDQDISKISANQFITKYYVNEQITIPLTVDFTLDSEPKNNFLITYQAQITDKEGTVYTDSNGYATITTSIDQAVNETFVIFYDKDGDGVRDETEVYDTFNVSIVERPNVQDFPIDIYVELQDSEYEINERITFKIYTDWDSGVSNKSGLEIKCRLRGGYETPYEYVYTDVNGYAQVNYTIDSEENDVYLEVFEEGGLSATSEMFDVIKPITENIEEDTQEEDKLTPSVIIGTIGLGTLVVWYSFKRRYSTFDFDTKWDSFIRYGYLIGIALVIGALNYYYAWI